MRALAPALRAAPRTALTAILAALAACGGDDDPAAEIAPRAPIESPPTARPDMVDHFRADLAAPRHASDGGGTCRLVEAPERIRAGESGRWVIELTVGPEGVAVGGRVSLMPETFWGWSTPQAMRRDLPGFTNVTLSRDDVELTLETLGGAEAGLILGTVVGAPLVEGDTVTFEYGAGPRGAYADRHADAAARLWIGVDGDGDGTRELVASSPTIEVLPRDAERLVLLGPSVARPGATLRYHVSALDGAANRAPDADGEWDRTVTLAGAPEDWQVPDTVELSREGFAAFDVVAGAASDAAIRLTASFAPYGADSRATCEANPLVVDAELPLVLWADLHGHSGLSDGTGTPRDYFVYARDTARLDVIALTDHDHYGARFLDARDELVRGIARVTEEFHEPGRFVTVHGYEWTNWIHGHRHVLSFEGESIEVRSSIDERFDTPTELWDALRGSASLTIAHHSSGQPIAVNWSYAPDPVLEPVTEVASVHGSSEARDAPVVVRGSRDGAFVRDQLVNGLRLGFIGSGDSHDGHPGLAHLSPLYGWRSAALGRPALSGQSGLAAIVGAEATRAGVLEALRARACYATSGPRALAVARWTDDRVELRFHGTAEVDEVTLVTGTREGARLQRVAGVPRAADVRLTVPVPRERAFAYLRVVQVDGAVTWTAPVFD